MIPDECDEGRTNLRVPSIGKRTNMYPKPNHIKHYDSRCQFFDKQRGATIAQRPCKTHKVVEE
jgi:hypothetical protein